MEIIGNVIQILPITEGVSAKTGNTWMIKTFIIETQENFPRKVAIEIFGEDKIKDNPCKEGDLVTVSFDLESREFNGRWYTSVRAWKIKQGVAEPQPQRPSAPPTDQLATAVGMVQETFDTIEQNSELPF